MMGAVLLVILGAGASHDYSRLSSPEIAPPLANELFSARDSGDALRRYPQIAGVVPRLRHLDSGITLEQRLDELQAEADKDYPRAAIDLMATRYYLRWVLFWSGDRVIDSTSHVTNYAELFARLDRWRKKANEEICVVTFNYDLMLEDAASAALDFTFDSLESYVTRQDWQFYRVHGSCNWGQTIQNAELQNMTLDERGVINLARTLQFGHYLMWREAPGQSYSGLREAGSLIPLAPAIALPLRNKTTFSCPAEHIDKLRDRLGHATRLLVIGWRAQDQNFVDLLSRSPVVMPTCIVANSQRGTEEVSARLGRAGYIGRHGLIHGGFAYLFDHPAFQELLS